MVIGESQKLDTLVSIRSGMARLKRGWIGQRFYWRRGNNGKGTPQLFNRCAANWVRDIPFVTALRIPSMFFLQRRAPSLGLAIDFCG